MSLVAQQKVLNAIRKAFCPEGSESPTENLFVSEAFKRTWANLGDSYDGGHYSPAEVYEQLMELTRPNNGAPAVIITSQAGSRLEWSSTIPEAVAISSGPRQSQKL